MKIHNKQHRDLINMCTSAFAALRILLRGGQRSRAPVVITGIC